MILKKTDAVTSERPFDKSKSLRGNSRELLMAADEKNGREDKYIPGVAYEDELRDCFTMDLVKV